MKKILNIVIEGSARMRVAQVTIHLQTPATNETSDCTKGEQFSEYSKDRSATCIYAFHILVKRRIKLSSIE
jgi:hypothetical protein